MIFLFTGLNFFDLYWKSVTTTPLRMSWCLSSCLIYIESILIKTSYYQYIFLCLILLSLVEIEEYKQAKECFHRALEIEFKVGYDRRSIDYEDLKDDLESLLKKLHKNTEWQRYSFKIKVGLNISALSSVSRIFLGLNVNHSFHLYILHCCLYTGWPTKNGTVDTDTGMGSIIPGGPQKTEQSIQSIFQDFALIQQSSFFTLLDRASFPHYNNTKIIKFGWELFILWVISYGLSFSEFARFPEFRGTSNDKSMANPEWQSIRNYHKIKSSQPNLMILVFL